MAVQSLKIITIILIAHCLSHNDLHLIPECFSPSLRSIVVIIMIISLFRGNLEPIEC
jgi:hypothetical protein